MCQAIALKSGGFILFLDYAGECRDLDSVWIAIVEPAAIQLVANHGHRLSDRGSLA